MEIMQKFSDAPLTECPACKEQALHKLVSAAAFHLKGSGWYATDFKDKPKSAETDKQAAETKETKPADTGKTDKQECGKNDAKPDKAGTGSNKSSSTNQSD